jgi:outer membrane protein assembly factor BamB
VDLNVLIFDKKKLNKNLVVLCLMGLGVTACSSTDDVDEFEPAELVEITQQFEAKVLWEENIGGGADDYFSRSTPIVAYEKLYTSSREGDVAALDVDTGKTLWSVDLREDHEDRGFFESRHSALLSGGPTAGINKIFIGSENGKVFALDAETGTVDWQSKIKGEVLAAPAIDSGVLAVNTASGILKAFNASNGEELWKVEQDTPSLTLRGISAPAISSGGVFVGTPDGNLTVYIIDNGQQGWSAIVGEPSGSTEFERVIDVDASPVVFGDRVYSISSRGNLVAIDLRSGQVVWKRQYSSHTDLLVSANNIYLTDTKGHVYALDRLNGTERWSQLALTNRDVTGPAEIGDYIVVGDYEGYLHWLNSETGEIVSRQEVDSSGIHVTPTVSDDVLFTQARNGDIQAIKAP